MGDDTVVDSDVTRADASVDDESATGEGDPLIGVLIDGRYEIIEWIGTGGMGVVYRARHVRLETDVVLKTLRPELTASEKTRARFTREAQSSTKVQHPHVIKVHDYGVHPDFGAYYVMEHLDGIDLAAAMRKAKDPIPIPRALHITRQVASALGSAHRARVVHRDLKPENVFLIERDGHPDFVKVLDFGLARLMDANRRLTETGQVIGTPRYMAPEQCQGNPVDARADVYSLALILHQMITGRQPYQGLGTYEILGQKMFDAIPAPSAMKPPVEIPAPLERFLMRCLGREPDARPADGAKMGEDMARLVEQLGVEPGPFVRRSSLANVEAWPEAEPDSAVFGRTSSGPKSVSSPERAKRGAFSIPPPEVVAGPPSNRRSIGVALGVAFLVMALGGPLVWLGLTYGPGADRGAGPRDAIASTGGPASVETAEAPAEPVEEITVVTIASEPPGAEVRFGEQLLGETPLEVRLEGELGEGAQVEVSLEGHVAREISLFAAVPHPHVRLHPVSGDE